MKRCTPNIHKTLLKAHDLGSMVTCGKSNFDGRTGENVDANGLVAGHIYSVTKVVVAQTNDGEEKVWQCL